MRRPSVAQAAALEAGQRWEDAARAWAAVRDRSDGDQARNAAGRCQSCWRRGDRPRLVLEAGDAALALGLDPIQASTVRLSMASACAQLGELERAEGLSKDAVRGASSAEQRELAMDTLLGIWLQRGELVAFAGALAADPRDGPSPPREFRRVQRDRLIGRLDEAVMRLEQLERNLGLTPPVRGACAAELGEIALVRGEHEQAMALFAESARAWEQASRMAPRWSAEAARGLAASWIAPDGVGLDVGVAWARRRGLVGLEAWLRLARGLCATRSDPTSGARDLSRAQELADGAGARLISGRIRWLRCTVGLGDLRELERAVVELTGDAGWWAPAALALAEALAQDDRARGVKLAMGAHTCFVGMHLIAEQERALDTIKALSGAI